MPFQVFFFIIFFFYNYNFNVRHSLVSCTVVLLHALVTAEKLQLAHCSSYLWRQRAKSNQLVCCNVHKQNVTLARQTHALLAVSSIVFGCIACCLEVLYGPTRCQYIHQGRGWKWRLYHQPPCFLWLRLISCYGLLLPFCFYVPLQKIRFCLRNVNCFQTPKHCALWSWSINKLQIFVCLADWVYFFIFC